MLLQVDIWRDLENRMGMDRTNYIKQYRLSLVQFLSELPNFFLLIASVLLTGSLIIWMDFLDSLGNVLRTATAALVARHLYRKLHQEEHHSISKIENLAVLFCDGLVMCGLMVGVALSIYEIITPHRPSDLLIYVTGLKVVNVAFDGVFWYEQGKIRKNHAGLLSQSNYVAALGMLLFDAVELLSILLIWACKNSPWTWYFSPVISMLIAVYLGYQCVGRLGQAVGAFRDSKKQ